MRPESRVFEVTLEGLPTALMTQAGSETPPSRSVRLVAPADAVQTMRILVTRPGTTTDEMGGFSFVVTDLHGSDTTRYDTRFTTPKR